MREHPNDDSKEQRAKSEATGRTRRGRPHWRFEDLEIWNKAVDLAVKFQLIAERLISAGFIVIRSNCVLRAFRFPTI
jgi:hypothetical protein